MDKKGCDDHAKKPSSETNSPDMSRVKGMGDGKGTQRQTDGKWTK